MRTKSTALALAASLLVAPAVMAQTAPQPGTGSNSPTTAPGMNPPPATTPPATAPGTMGTAPGATGSTTAAPGTAAPRTDATPTTATPAAGANSFTEGQARSRIEGAGYTDVQNLRKDDQGVWRGQAMRNGTRSDVGLDFQGNVVVGNAPAASR